VCATLATVAIPGEPGGTRKSCDPWSGSATAHLVRFDTLPGGVLGYPDYRPGPRVRIVVDDPDHWPAAWTLALGASPPPPAVDFTKVMAIIVASKTQPDGAGAITIDSLVADRGTLYVITREQTTCRRLDALSRPIVAIAVPYQTEDVRFIDRHSTERCMPLRRR
jgi:hypothetical protein